MVGGGAILTLGGDRSELTLVEAAAVQPFAGLVTTTEYDPTPATIDDVPCPDIIFVPVQLKVAPETPVIAVMFTCALGVLQFIMGGCVKFKSGGVVLADTLTDCEAVQPLLGLVTTTI